MRQRRLLGDLFGAPSDARRGDFVDALRFYQNVLRSDGDCYGAWMALSVLFRDLADETRAERCLGVARHLRRRAPAISASV